MFTNSKAFSSFAVNDIQKAKHFYGTVLALKLSDEREGTMGIHLEGGAVVFVYPKPDHAPASFTVLNFPVEDIKTTIKNLTDKGIKMERYDEDVETDEHGIFRDGDMQIAWFKDPSGNILSVIQS